MAEKHVSGTHSKVLKSVYCYIFQFEKKCLKLIQNLKFSADSAFSLWAIDEKESAELMYFLEKVNSGDKKVTRATLFAKKLIAK